MRTDVVLRGSNFPFLGQGISCPTVFQSEERRRGAVTLFLPSARRLWTSQRRVSDPYGPPNIARANV